MKPSGSGDENATRERVVPKSYRSEGQPRSTSDEFPSRAVFGNSRQFQYDGLLPFTYTRSSSV